MNKIKAWLIVIEYLQKYELIEFAQGRWYFSS